MANDCDFKVRIFGESPDMKKLNEALSSEPIKSKNSLNNETYSSLFESSSEVEDWGSKWTIFSNIDCDERQINIAGYSAWSPTDGLWKKISKDFNCQVECEYSEPGMDLAGMTTWVNGQETRSEKMTYFEYLYEKDNSYFWEEVVSQCEWDSLDGVKESLSGVWNKLSDNEKSKVEELHKDNFLE